MTMAEVPGEQTAVVGAVEVLKDEHSRMWYSGHVLDMVGKDKILVGFDKDVWPKQEFPYSRVRKQTKGPEMASFNPRVGDEVELRCNATEHEPAGWGAAVVKNTKHSFFFVSRVSSTDPDGKSEAIVEKAMLRPMVSGDCLDAHGGGALKTEVFKVAPGLRDWLATDDAMGCFARIEIDSGLMFIKVGRNDLKLVGDDKAVTRAKMLLDVHQKHQVQIQNFQDMREKRLSALEKRRNRIEGTGYKHSIEIQIEPSFVKRVIGTKGENIRNVMQKYDVNIHIPDCDDEKAVTRTVRIFGNNMESIELARGEVEFIEEVYPEPIEPAMFAWIRGRDGKTLNKFKDLTGILYARVDRDTQQMTICGTRIAVEEAIAMFESHMMYFPVFSQMDEEMEQLVQQLEEYGDHSARWDWGWHRDDDEDDGWGGNGYGGGKSSGSKGKAKGGRGGGAGDWKETSSGGGKGKGKGKEWEKPQKESWNQSWKDEGDWNDNWKEDWNDNWRGQTSVSQAREGGKSGGKGKGAKGGKAKAWEEEEEEPPKKGSRPAKGASKSGKGSGKQAQEEESDEAEEEPEPKGKGRGRGARGPRVVRDEDEVHESAAAPKAAATRRMGKKGIRTTE